MSFKKFLAPVLSCCCAASSLVSPCQADAKKYKRNKLLCFNASDLVDKRSRCFVVEKNNETEMPKRCKKCNKNLNGTGFIIGHDFFPFSSEYTRDDQNNWISGTTALTKQTFNCMVCRECAEKLKIKIDAFCCLISGEAQLVCPVCNGYYWQPRIYKITQKDVPVDLWEDYGNYIIAGGVIFVLLDGMLITAVFSENAEGSNRKKGIRVGRKNQYKYENNYDGNYDDEDDGTDGENEVYA